MRKRQAVLPEVSPDLCWVKKTRTNPGFMQKESVPSQAVNMPEDASVSRMSQQWQMSPEKEKPGF